MNWSLPGTTLSIQKEEIATVERQFTAMFLGGGMMLSQVCAVTGLEAYTVQNWVKRGFLPAPAHKRYNVNQLCRIITINMLKSALSMERITGLIGYVNGELDDDSDDMIDDARLYFLFVHLAAQLSEKNSPEKCAELIRQELQSYVEPVPGAKARVEQVLRIMLIAWSASKLQHQAEEMVSRL